MEFNPTAATSFTFKGPFSGEEMHGLAVDVTVLEEEHEKLEEILEEREVEVFDSHRDRLYRATPHTRSSSYTVGSGVRRYEFTVREIDRPPDVNSIEIQGRSFDVIRYRESLEDNELISRHAILRLTEDEFADLLQLFELDRVEIRRVGVDEQPLVVRFGGGSYWSSEEENDETIIKQIVRFYPPELPSSRNLLASGTGQSILRDMVADLSIRYTALIETLSDKNLLTEEEATRLKWHSVTELMPERRIRIAQSYLWFVADAEEHFG